MGAGTPPLNDALRISVREQRNTDSVLRIASFTLAAGPVSVFYKITGEVLPPPLEVLDFALVAAIHVAMREGRPVHVEGPVTGALLRSLEEYQEIWALWRRTYRRVQISADQVVSSTVIDDRHGVFAISGGVDGAFALLKHHSGLAGPRNVRPACAMFVHGFDIPLHEQAAFGRARDGIVEMVAPLGVPVTIVETNWREALGRDWAMDCQVALTACLHQFRGAANVGVCGAADDYAHITVPLGSNPVTNHLLSGGGFDIMTEGGALTRTDRVRALCDHPQIAAKLRVCWEGPKTGRNCGRCEKCIRTKLNFMAVGSAPLCFDGPPTFLDILRIKLHEPSQVQFLREIVAAAKANDVRGAWLVALRLAMVKNKLVLRSMALERRIRKVRYVPRTMPRTADPRDATPHGGVSPTSAAAKTRIAERGGLNRRVTAARRVTDL